jgi:DNA polymerase-4
MSPIILHLDMNSYCASVEQQANPFLRGKPLGVCAYLSENGCIIASSVEAKQRGVKTAMRVRDARRLCPEILLVENEPAKYRSTTEKIFSILDEYTDELEPYSIDEAFLNLTGWSKNFNQARQLAESIRQRIKQEVGEWLRCSIGISYTRWLAKFASDITPPDSVKSISPEQLTTSLDEASLLAAWGINYRLEARLKALGIHTLNQLRTYPVTNLRRALGITGYYLWANVNGIQTERVHRHQSQQPKSIGHSYCLPRKTTDRNWLRGILHKLCERTGRRLRAKQMEADRIGAWLQFAEGGGMGRQCRVPERLFTTESIFKSADRLLFTRPLADRARFLAVNVSNLHPLSHQRSLFQDELRPKRLSLALDTLNNKFGEFSVYPGVMWGTNDNAHDRVGYRKTVSVREMLEDVEYMSE